MDQPIGTLCCLFSRGSIHLVSNRAPGFHPQATLSCRQRPTQIRVPPLPVTPFQSLPLVQNFAKKHSLPHDEINELD